MTLLLASGLGAGVIVHAAGRRLSMAAAALAVIATLIAFSVPGAALALWPRAADWPTLPSVTRGLRLGDLWRTLRAAPPGRVLFVRSGVPLVYGSAWYRPHTHVTALTPVLADRDILGGTFTHGSPIAALVYRGDTRREPITRLAEQLDGASLFGQALDTLDAGTFERYAGRFHVAAVVALEDDAEHLLFLTDNPRYRRAIVPPFLVFSRIDAPRPARRLADGSRELHAQGGAGEWISTGIAYYPLWRAERAGRPLATRRGHDGVLEIRADAGMGAVRLAYRPGVAEFVASLTSAVAVAALAADAWRRRARSALRDVPAGEDAERRADRV
jgi:hypothetical protein